LNWPGTMNLETLNTQRATQRLVEGWALSVGRSVQWNLNPAHLENTFVENGPNRGFRRRSSAAVGQFA